MDASLAFMASAVVPFLVTGQPMERTGNTGYSGQPTAALFEAGDGKLISLGVVQQGQFESLARLLKRDEWLTDPRFATPDSRRANAAALQAFLSAAFRRRPAAEWEQIMSTAGIPCGMVRDVAQACALPHLEQRGLKIPLTVPGLPTNENIEILNAGFQFLNDGPTLDAPPPAAGQHTEEILRWLGIEEPRRDEILRHSKP